jgi:hypothetical protein
VISNRLSSAITELLAELKRPELHHIGPLVRDVERELRRAQRREIDLDNVERLQRALILAGLPLHRDPTEWLTANAVIIRAATIEHEAKKAGQAT